LPPTEHNAAPTLLLGCCFLAAWCSVPALAQEPAGTAHPELWPARAPGLLIRPEAERFIDQLLTQMTIEEKVGQLIQADITSITPADLLHYRLGSIQAGGNSAPGNNVRTTPQAWLELTEAFYEASVKSSGQPHPSIPILFAIDAVHGHARIRGATIFPHNIALGATHDPGLIRRIGEITAEEVATTGIDWSFAPTLAVVRDVRWGRTYESYSEDPALVSGYAGQMITGLQGELGTDSFLGLHHTITSAKHFLGDGGTAGGHDQGDNLASEQELIRVHGAGYIAAINAGATTIMASYNSWHGVKMHGNHSLLTDVLKGPLGFDGFVVGDWNGQEELPGCTKSNCPAATLAGVDMLMAPDGWKELYGNLLSQARAGIIPAPRLDDAVRRILRVKVLAGLFDRPSPKGRPDAGHFERLGSVEHRAIARQAVRESLVLLKNEHALLPLDPHKRLLVAGDGADNLGKQAGGWTVDWQGDHNTTADFPNATSIYAGIKAAVRAAGGTVAISPDGGYSHRPDAAIVVFGENPYAEFEGDRENLSFSGSDRRSLAILRRLHAHHIPVVAVFLAGRPLWVNPELNASDAFVVAWLPGTEGEGIADVLLRAPDGSVSHDFTGRLSFSWPKTAIPVRLDDRDQPSGALFPRGFGLDYSNHATLPRLSEEPRIPPELSASDSLFAAGHVTTPWSIYVEDTQAAVRLTNLMQASPMGAVQVALNGAGVGAAWSGNGTGTLRFSGRGIDLRSKAANGGVVSMRYRVDRAASAAIEWFISCGRECRAPLPLSDRIAMGEPGRWQTLKIPLACFRVRGGDLSDVETPFALTTGGSLSLTFSEIKLEASSPPFQPECAHSD
jgi:beta-glucosidase